MYRILSHDEIEKNKWNGTVHYANNGNVYGHYWYLKSVYKQWSAVVEDDYISVLPILPPAHSDEYLLTPELGPYSVKALTPDRTEAMVDLMLQHSTNAYYPLHSTAQTNKYPQAADKGIAAQTLHLIDDYDTITKQYSENTISVFDKIKKEQITFVSSIKPELIVAQESMSKAKKDAYLRIMYNALHRGLGWSQGITDRRTGKYLALSFFVMSHNVVHEIFSLSRESDSYKLLLYDMSFKQSAGKPTLFKTYHTDGALIAMGAEAVTHSVIKLRSPSFLGIKEKLGRRV